MRLVLASSSSRRAALLEGLGLAFEVQAVEVDERRVAGEAPSGYVERVARAKADVTAGPGRIVVAGDTTVVHEGRILGKPAHAEEARGMLRRLQGGHHEVVTGLAVASWDRGAHVDSVVDLATVELLSMTEEEIADYVATGEPLDKAGAYALQGIGGVYVSRVAGSPFTVMGLPIHLLPRLLGRAGAKLSMFRRHG